MPGLRSALYQIRRMPRRTGRLLRRIQRRVRKRARRKLDGAGFFEPQKPWWNTLRGPRLALGLYRDEIERILHALARSGPVFFVQVGANDGVECDPVHPFVVAEGWPGILLEPLAPVFQRLQANYAGRPDVRLERLALAAEAGHLDFFRLDDPKGRQDQIGSLSRETLVRSAWQVQDVEQKIVSERVECITFAQLCERHGLDAVDLLQIDAEGGDYDVIRGIDFERVAPALLVYEHRHLAPPERKALDQLLESQGYDRLDLRFDSLALRRDARKTRQLEAAWQRITAHPPTPRYRPA